MPMERRCFVYGAIFVAAAVLLAFFAVPGSYRLMVLMGGYLLLLLLGLGYYHFYRQVLEKVRIYDREEQFARQIAYLDAVEKRGYSGFVFDSYRIYACYMLGDFEAYEKTAAKMAASARWQKPKMKDFREKVEDNLACIAFLRQWAESQTMVYSGNNVLLLQSIEDCRQQNTAAIRQRLEAYNLPKLKKACLYALCGQFDKIDALYESQEAKAIFEKIKEREVHG